MSDAKITPRRALEQIWDYLSELKIRKEYATQSMMRAYHPGIFGEIKVMIQAHESGVMISVNPVVERPFDGWGDAVQKLIVALNKQAHLVQVGQDQDGDVYVKVELPLQDIIFGEFLSVFLSICRIAEDLLVPVWQAHVYDNFNKKAA